MNEVQSIFRTLIFPIPYPSAQSKGREWERKNINISKETIKLYPRLDNPEGIKFYMSPGTTHFHSGGSHTYFV